MNVGLGNLTELKAQLLAGAVKSQTTYDTAITAIGLGVARSFDKVCNRKFARIEDDTFICPANRDFVYLPRYPVENVTKTELKEDETSGFVTQTGFIIAINEFSGHVHWGFEAGPDYAQLRFTYDGGYWFDASEDASETQPADTTKLPDDLKFAWFLQCQEVWNLRDKLGLGLATLNPDKNPRLDALEIIPAVQAILSAFKRYTLA